MCAACTCQRRAFTRLVMAHAEEVSGVALYTLRVRCKMSSLFQVSNNLTFKKTARKVKPNFSAVLSEIAVCRSLFTLTFIGAGPLYLRITNLAKELSHHGKASSCPRHVECLTTLRHWTPAESVPRVFL